ncbi:MAG TPA: helix-turn-helix transcriptional regulator [Phycisphaerae bacterium]|nr:helix-turn-helix transcriptional regulator [Phycisphaerae bacterium]
MIFNRKAFRRFRIEKEMSQVEVARLAGCLGNDISRYERGEKIPREGRIRRLAQALSVPESTLYTNPPTQSDAIRARIEMLLEDMSEAEKAEILTIMLRMAEKRQKPTE